MLALFVIACDAGKIEEGSRVTNPTRSLDAVTAFWQAGGAAGDLSERVYIVPKDGTIDSANAILIFEGDGCDTLPGTEPFVVKWTDAATLSVYFRGDNIRMRKGQIVLRDGTSVKIILDFQSALKNSNIK